MAVSDDAFDERLGQLVAQDVHWIMQRTGVAVSSLTSEPLIIDSRYTRMLRAAAEIQLAELESEVLEEASDG